jgi:hypothetical protein
MLEVQGISRTTTVIALSAQIGYRVLPLVSAARSGAAPTEGIR